jgi:hypothetical protein
MLKILKLQTTHLTTFQVGLSSQDKILFYLLRLVGFPLLPAALEAHLEILILGVKGLNKYFYRNILRSLAR